MVTESARRQKQLHRRIAKELREAYLDEDDIVFATSTTERLVLANSEKDKVWQVVDGKMSTPEQEILLQGGMLNPNIVRVGDTVHRTQSPNAQFAHQLLGFLEGVNFAEAPRFLGIDDQDREILTYFKGTVLPGGGFILNNAQLQNVGRLIRRYHDTTASSPLRGNQEIVAHGELGPHNTVFQGNKPVAFIDWDDAGPGTRLRDLAYAVDCYIDLGNKDLAVTEQVRRLELLCDAYEWARPGELLEDIRQDYRRALANHQRSGNIEAIRIFTDLVAFLDVRTGAMDRQI